MTRWQQSLAGTALACLGLVSSFQTTHPPAQSVKPQVSIPQRLAEMRHHFSEVIDVHEAVIRGDLRSVRPLALTLATMPVPKEMPAAAWPLMADIHRAGRLAADATSLAAAARATVSLASACGSCHRKVGVFPAASRSVGHDVGGVVGHMLDHQRATDLMLIALIVPSDSEWQSGAERLRVATLLPTKFPSDPKLTREIRALDLRVHAMADHAIDAETPGARVQVYTDLITTCSQCHSLHSRVWGPGRGGGGR